MSSDAKRSMTGFYVRSRFKSDSRGIKIEDGTIVEILKDGFVIAAKLYKSNITNMAEIEANCLEQVITNLGLSSNFGETKRNEVLGVVNMFKIYILKNYSNDLQDIKITFLRNGHFFTESTFKEVSNHALEEIRAILADNTAYNLGCKEQCRAITVLDMIAIIEQKLQQCI